MQKFDLMTNMSPVLCRRPNHPIAHLKKTPFSKLSDRLDLKKEHRFGSVTCLLEDKMAAKTSDELMKEIAMLESEILLLEQNLLSRYRAAFEPHLLSLLGYHGINGEQETATPTWARVLFSQDSHSVKSRMSNGSNDHPAQSSPRSALDCSRDSVHRSVPKLSFEREKKNVCSRHHSLADYLGNLRTTYSADKLSEEIVICVSSIYCKLANPSASLKGCSASSTSSFCSSSTFSPRNLSGSWSPQCNDETRENCAFEGLKLESGPYSRMIEVLKICLDDETYGYAATMLQKFRSLVKSLENIDPRKMKREEKLAFWINIHNALVMHAYLAYGAQNDMKTTSIVKASYNVGGQCVTAYDIKSSILGIGSQHSAPWLQTILSPGKKFKTGGVSKHVYAMEYPEPLVHFALSSGAFSDPAVRAYQAKTVFQDLKLAKEEYIQETVYVHKETRICLPRILSHYAKDMSLGMTELLAEVGKCLSVVQQNAVKKCLKGRPDRHVHWLEQTSSFRFLIHKDVASRGI